MSEFVCITKKDDSFQESFRISEIAAFKIVNFDEQKYELTLTFKNDQGKVNVKFKNKEDVLEIVRQIDPTYSDIPF